MTFTISRKVLYVVGGIAVIVIAGVIGALIGGGGRDTTVVKTVEVTAPAAGEEGGEEEAAFEAEEEEAETAEAGDCDEKGINSTVGKEGRCTEEGTTLVVVDKGSVLSLEELDAKLVGMETAKTLSGEYGETKSANGVYVVFRLEVTNKTHSPVYFDSGQEQTALYLGENEYTEDFEAENWVLEDSFLNTFEKLQPGAPVTGSIAFDVPRSVLPDLHKTGNLDIANFSDEGEGEWDPIGVIRTYE